MHRPGEYSHESTGNSPHRPPISDQVAIQALAIFVGQLVQTAHVHVVFKVRELNAACDRFGGGPLDEFVVGFAFALGHAIERVEEVLGKAFSAQSFHRPDITMVFHNIMQHRDDALILGSDTEHHAERMDNVGLTSLVLFASMGLDRNGNGSFEE